VKVFWGCCVYEGGEGCVFGGCAERSNTVGEEMIFSNSIPNDDSYLTAPEWFAIVVVVVFLVYRGWKRKDQDS